MITGMKNKTILVTGGAGFIGSHTAKKLLSLGYGVILLDRFKKSKNIKRKKATIASLLTHPQLAIVDADILNKTSLNNMFRKRKIDIVLHLAAQADVPWSISYPYDTLNTNLLGTTLLLDLSRKSQVSHFVYASSALVYEKKTAPLKEDDPCSFQTSPYAISVRQIELVSYVFYQKYRLSTTGLRLFPVFGPFMRPNLVVPMLVKNISQGKPVIILGNGQQKRSYTYIDDIIDGIIAVINQPSSYQLINLGSPIPISLLDLVNAIEKMLKKKVKRIFKPARKEDTPLLYPDISKAKKLLGFSPKIPLEEGIRRYVRWYNQAKRL